MLTEKQLIEEYGFTSIEWGKDNERLYANQNADMLVYRENNRYSIIDLLG